MEWINTMEEDDSHLDFYLATASEAYARKSGSSHKPTPPISTSSTPSASNRFAPPKSDAEIQHARQKAVPKSTQQDTRLCMKIWEEWTKHRLHTTGTYICPLLDMTGKDMQYRLSQFVVKVRKRDSTVYPPNTLHHIVCGLMRYLQWNGRPDIDFFKDPDFCNFRASLDAEMKRLQSQGEGSKKKQAELLTEEEEKILWDKGYLGDAQSTASY